MGAPDPERAHRDGSRSDRSAVHRDRGAGRARLDAHVPEQLTQCDLTVAGISGTETEDDVAVGVTRSAQSCVMLVMRSHLSMECARAGGASIERDGSRRGGGLERE